MRCSRLWLSIAWLTPLMFTACATIGPPRPPTLDLPKPPSDLRATRKGEKVTLTWTIPTSTTDRQVIDAVGPTQICRGPEELKACGTPTGEAPAESVAATKSAKSTKSEKKKSTESYTDTLPQTQSNGPEMTITYAVEVLNANRRGAGLSNQVRIPLVRTLPPPQGFQAEVTRDGVVLSWAGDVSAVSTDPTTQYSYRVYRTPEGSAQSTLVGELPASADSHLSLTDSEIEWQKTYTYRADTVTTLREANKPEVQVEGDDTPEVKVFANDVFPPAVPSSLQAVFSGPGQKPFIDLVWAPVSDADLAGYNIYRHQEGTPAVKLNAEVVTSPAYRDSNITPGKRYVYSVSAVDVRGNESAVSDEASETVPQ